MKKDITSVVAYLFVILFIIALSVAATQPLLKISDNSNQDTDVQPIAKSLDSSGYPSPSDAPFGVVTEPDTGVFAWITNPLKEFFGVSDNPPAEVPPHCVFLMRSPNEDLIGYSVNNKNIGSVTAEELDYLCYLQQENDDAYWKLISNQYSGTIMSALAEKYGLPPDAVIPVCSSNIWFQGIKDGTIIPASAPNTSDAVIYGDPGPFTTEDLERIEQQLQQ